MSVDRLWQVVEMNHRAELAAAAAADARHRPGDTLVKVCVSAAFWLAGREAQPGEVVEVPNYLVSGLRVTGHITTQL
jgi:hypothetical protein